VSAPLSAADRAAIVRICVLTQGQPLALVLAAHWTTSLSTAAIAQELAGSMDLLVTPGARRPERHRSMREILQATWARLSAAERAALRRLAVFQAGFTRAAGEAVAGVALPLLLMLGEHGLLGRDPAAERYTMHEFVRQYAAEQLAADSAEETVTRRRHAAFYAALVQQVTPALRQTIAAQEVISADIANVRVAWDWAAERADAGVLEQMLEGLALWHRLQGLPGQAAEALDRAAQQLRAALAQPATPSGLEDRATGWALQRLLGFVLVEEASALGWQAAYPRVRALLEEARELARLTASPHLEGRVALHFGHLLSRQRDPRHAVQMQQALALVRAAKEPTLEADALDTLGSGAAWAGEYRQARAYLEQAFSLYRTKHDRFGELAVSYTLSQIAHARGEFDEARRLLEDGLQLTRVLGHHIFDCFLLHELGLVYDEGWGRHLEAEDCFAQDLRQTQETGDRTREGFALAGLGRNALYLGDLDRAGRLLARALSVSQEVNSRGSAAIALRGQSLLAHYLGDDRRARRCAEETLAIARTAELRRDERLAVRLLGHALYGLGELPAAQGAYQQAADLDEVLGFEHLRVETATDLARVALAQGDTAQALMRVAAIVPDLEQGALAGLEEPVLAYLTCYRVLRAAGDARAAAVLAAGHALLQDRVTQFGEDERRSGYLGNLPAHRDLLAAWRAHGGRTVEHLRIVRPGSS
jgi:tetratricopeptide (TPR) repeat protein